MNVNDLKPAKEFAVNFGVKACVYGPPGEGKTPITLATATRPVLLASEPGLLSARKSTVPTWPAFNSMRLDEFFTWFTQSAEAKAFDTLIWDSASQSSETIIDDLMLGKTKSGNKRHGKEAYGEMGNIMMGYCNKLYFMPEKHIILICKQELLSINDMQIRRPYFAGQMLPVRIPHLFDLIMHLGMHAVPGVIPSPTKAFRCRASFDTMARTRFDEINEFEPPDISKIIAKAYL